MRSRKMARSVGETLGARLKFVVNYHASCAYTSRSGRCANVMGPQPELKRGDHHVTAPCASGSKVLLGPVVHPTTGHQANFHGHRAGDDCAVYARDESVCGAFNDPRSQRFVPKKCGMAFDPKWDHASRTVGSARSPFEHSTAAAATAG